MKTQLKVTLILLLLCASILAVNTSITPILANNTENEISACPEEPTCSMEPVCKETCMDISVVIVDMHAIFMGEGVSGTGPLRWEGTATFSDGTVLTSIAYADAAPSFVGPDADWSAFGAGMQGELEIFREEVELKNKCGEVVAVGYEQGIFNITSSEFNVAGELKVCGDAGPLTGQTVDKFYTTGLVRIDDCGAFHAEGRTIYVLCNDSECSKTCPAPEIVIATAHAVFMGEGVSGTGPLRWEGTVTFADGTELVWIAYADPAPSFVGPDADWSAFGAGMQGELEIFREEVEYTNTCGDMVASGYEQGIFNITSSEFNVAGEIEICGDVGPLTDMYIEKFFTTGLVWTDNCGAFHAEGCTLFLLADEPCPEEPECPTPCPEPCPEEPACPEVCGPTVTSITGFGWFDVEACPNPDNRNAVTKQTCAYNLSKGIAVQFKHDWDVFGEGVNINNLNIVELTDGTWYLWGTNVLEFCGVTLSGYVTGIKTPDDQLFARYVNYGEEMLVIWDSEGNLLEGNVTGVIVEGCDLDGFACAWPDVTWHCGSEVTSFTGWAEPAMIPPVLDPGVLAATVGDWEIWKRVQIDYLHYWDSSCWVNKTFGNGEVINTFHGIADTTTGSQILVGTHELTFDCLTLTGTVTGHIFLDDTGNSVTIGTWVGTGDGYLVIWYFDSRLERQDYGVIIEI